MRSRETAWVLGGLSLLLFSYAAVRACTVSFSWDEAYTFMNHVRKNVFFLTEHDVGSANHHLLNVWGMWICAKLFGTSELSLRLPNLLGHVIYLYATARLALKAEHAALAVVVFLLLNVHPYLLDFFGLARGYGLSNGLMMLSLWQLYRFSTEGRTARAAILGTTCAALATLANTMLLNFLLGLVAVIIGAWLVEARAMGRRMNSAPLLIIAAIAGLAATVVVTNAVGLLHAGALFHGSEGPWKGMIGSLAEKACYHFVTPLSQLTTMGIFLSIVAGCCVVALVLANRHGWNGLPLVLGLVVTGVILVSLTAQNVILDLPWPRHRTALFLLPLLSYLLAAALLLWRSNAWPPLLVGSLLVFFLLLHFGRSMNLTFAIEWRESGHLRQLLERIEKDHLPPSEERPIVTVSSGGQCGPVMDYYVHARGFDWLVNNDQVKQDSFPRSDYHLVEWTAEQWVEHPYWTLLYRSDETGTSLYRDERLHRPFRNVLFRGSVPARVSNVIVRDGIPEPRVNWTVPEDLAGEPILVTCTVRSLEQADNSWLTLGIDHLRDGQPVEHGGVASHHQIHRYGTWQSVSAQFMPKRPLLEGDEIALTVTPYIREPRINIGDVQLWILK